MAHDLSTPEGRRHAHVNMLWRDHGILRLWGHKLHKVADGFYRSAQPSPTQFARAQRKLGIRTVINLRGAHRYGSYILEQEVCDELGLTLIDFPLDSRDAPQKDRLQRANALLSEIEYPVLVHCKSGADRAGLMSVLYLLLCEKKPLEEAMGQLSLRYGHIKQAKTGILDFFFEAYRQANAETPIGFMDWVDTVYDHAALKKSFMSQWWANSLVDRLLRRE